MEQRSGISATFALVAAIGSFILTFAGRPMFGLLAALAAIPLGAIGIFMSASPRVGGGLMSIIAIVIALIAIGVAVLGLFGTLVF